MPASYNLPRVNQLWDQQSTELYNKLPFYLANLEAQYYPRWTVWNKFYGTIDWQENMGNIIKGVRAEPTPIGRQMFFPNDITSNPLKDIAIVKEVAETARVKRHLYESNQFNFNPSFADFRKNQIKFAMEDLTYQISYANDFFIRAQTFHYAPNVFISGKAGGTGGFAGNELVSAPSGIGNEAGTLAKTTAWCQEAVSLVGNNLGNLSFKVVKKAKSILSEDIQAPYWEGGANMPKPNETMKGTYCLIGSNEAFEYFSFDEFILANRLLNQDLQTDEFSGKIGAHIVYKSERFPLRIAADGTFPGPQLWESNPGAYNEGETVPNPAYVNAPFEVAFLCAANAMRTIKVGAPPKEFSSGSMTEEKFNKMQWNGEVKLTSNVLVNYGTIAAPVLDTNKYGEALQLCASTVHGIIPVNRRYVLPIIYRRVRVTTN